MKFLETSDTNTSVLGQAVKVADFKPRQHLFRGVYLSFQLFPVGADNFMFGPEVFFLGEETMRRRNRSQQSTSSIICSPVSSMSWQAWIFFLVAGSSSALFSLQNFRARRIISLCETQALVLIFSSKSAVGLSKATVIFVGFTLSHLTLI